MKIGDKYLYRDSYGWVLFQIIGDANDDCDHRVVCCGGSDGWKIGHTRNVKIKNNPFFVMYCDPLDILKDML